MAFLFHAYYYFVIRFMKNIVKLTGTIALFCITACKNEMGFVNYDKWKIPNRPGQGFVRGNPKEVKEQYFEIADTTLLGEGRMNGEEVYRFDNQGNLLDGYTMIDSLMYAEFSYKYSELGKAYKYYSYTTKAKDSMIGMAYTSTEKLSPNRFKIIHFKDSQKRYDEYYTFSNKRVDLETVVAPERRTFSTYWQQNNRLVKIDRTDGDGQTSDFYFYNSKGHLDSIIYKNKGKSPSADHIIGKEIFLNNEYGDPIITYSVTNNDTTDLEKNLYQYDSKKNWIRRLNHNPDGRRSKGLVLNKKFPDYTLSVREIIY